MENKISKQRQESAAALAHYALCKMKLKHM